MSMPPIPFRTPKTAWKNGFCSFFSSGGPYFIVLAKFHSLITEGYTGSGPIYISRLTPWIRWLVPIVPWHELPISTQIFRTGIVLPAGETQWQRRSWHTWSKKERCSLLQIYGKMSFSWPEDWKKIKVGANTLNKVNESTLVSQPKGENIGVVVLIFCDLTSLFTSICRQWTDI